MFYHVLAGPGLDLAWFFRLFAHHGLQCQHACVAMEVMGPSAYCLAECPGWHISTWRMERPTISDAFKINEPERSEQNKTHTYISVIQMWTWCILYTVCFHFAVFVVLRRCRGNRLPWPLLWAALRDSLIALDHLHRHIMGSHCLYHLWSFIAIWVSAVGPPPFQYPTPFSSFSLCKPGLLPARVCSVIHTDPLFV